jgi:hypothetical protein
MNHKYRILSLFVVMILLGTSISIPTNRAQALTEGPVEVLINLPANTLCLQVGNSTSDIQNGVAVNLRTCAYDNTIFQAPGNQTFTLEYMGPGSNGSNLFAVRAKHSSKCLVAANSSSGAAIVQTTCTVGTYWQFDGTYFRYHANTSKCIGIGSGTGVVLIDCNQQRWSTIPISAGLRIRSAYSWKCLDVNNASGGGLADGTNLQQYDCLGYNQTNQRWRVHVELCSGTAVNCPKIKLIALHSGKCARSSANVDGSRIKQYTCNNRATEFWTVAAAKTSSSGVHYKLTYHVGNSYDGALDLDNSGSGAGLQNGAKIQTWYPLGGTNQQWIFRHLFP